MNTDQTQIETSLVLAEAILKNSSQGIVVTDASGNIISINPAFTDITGYNEEDVLNKNMSIIGSGLNDQNFYQEYWRCLIEEGFWTGEIWNKKKNGVAFSQRSNISAIRDNKGNIINYIDIFYDVTEQVNTRKELDFLARYDPLTKLPNKNMLYEHTESEISKAQRRSKPFYILLIDLDYFKYVNDSFGHNIGDDLLKLVSKRLLDSIREVDFLSRYGADEFVAVMTDTTNYQEICEICERIIKNIGLAFEIGGHEVFIGASIGISSFPENGKDKNKLIANADVAMYSSKDRGRNTFSFYSEELTKQSRRYLKLQSEMHHALEHDEMHVFFQPQWDLQSNKIISCEALVRWIKADGRIIGPDDFIPIAEKSSLIIGIGDQVIKKSCKIAKQWLQNGLINHISINVSPKQFELSGFASGFMDTLVKEGLQTKQVLIEVTETTFLSEAQNIKDNIKDLHDLGVMFSIDDFGTGYSSMSMLKNLPISQLKIDQTFVSSLPSTNTDLAFVQAIIDLSKALKLNTVAEGIETSEQANILQKAGCNTGQGYLYSKPVPAIDFNHLLKKYNS